MKYIISLFALILVGAGGYWYLNQSGNFPPGGGPGGTTLTATEKLTCGLTATVTEGPYYVSGAPALTNGNLNYDNLAGSPLKITGHVYEGLDNAKPLANAVIDIWQTDTEGSYHPNDNGNILDYSDDEISLRGTVTTNVKGEYEFTTIYPGEYTGRTRHIHIKIRAQGYEELTTQLILSLNGDNISFDDDTVSQGLPNCHLLSLNAATPPTAATFDFRL